MMSSPTAPVSRNRLQLIILATVVMMVVAGGAVWYLTLKPNRAQAPDFQTVPTALRQIDLDQLLAEDTDPKDDLIIDQVWSINADLVVASVRVHSQEDAGLDRTGTALLGIDVDSGERVWSKADFDLAGADWTNVLCQFFEGESEIICSAADLDGGDQGEVMTIDPESGEVTDLLKFSQPPVGVELLDGDVVVALRNPDGGDIDLQRWSWNDTVPSWSVEVKDGLGEDAYTDLHGTGDRVAVNLAEWKNGGKLLDASSGAEVGSSSTPYYVFDEQLFRMVDQTGMVWVDENGQDMQHQLPISHPIRCPQTPSSDAVLLDVRTAAAEGREPGAVGAISVETDSGVELWKLYRTVSHCVQANSYYVVLQTDSGPIVVDRESGIPRGGIAQAGDQPPVSTIIGQEIVYSTTELDDGTNILAAFRLFDGRLLWSLAPSTFPGMSNLRSLQLVPGGEHLLMTSGDATLIVMDAE